MPLLQQSLNTGFPNTDTWDLLETGGIYNSGSLHPWWILYVYASTQLINFLRRRGSVAGVLTRLRAGSIMVRFPSGYDFSVQTFQTASGGRQTSSSVGTRGPYIGNEAAGAWSWPLPSSAEDAWISTSTPSYASIAFAEDIVT